MNRPLTPQEQAQRQQRARLCAYVRNTGQEPLAVHDFDDDWTPAGDMYRDDLLEAGLIEIREPGEDEPGGLYLTPAGAVLALCEARLAKAPLTLLVDGIFCGILIFICVEIYKTRGTVLGILICIPTFILCGFEHSIADIFYFCNARIFSWQAVLVVLLVALGNALGALIIPAARLVY